MLDILIPRLFTLKELGFNPKTVLDIGAHMGDWSRKVAEVWPEGKYFMVEANEDHRGILEQATWADGFEIALLGDTKKEGVEYFVSRSEYSTGNSVFKEQTHFFDDCEVRLLPQITLDHLVLKRKIKDIDFLKIDTQGSELAILKGAKKVLAQVEFVLLETQNLQYNLKAPDTCEVMEVMKELGFLLFDITEIHHLPTGEMLGVDLLFAKKDSRFIKRGKLL